MEAIMTSFDWWQIPGWYGMVMFPLAYFLVSYDFIPKGRLFHWMNLTGAVGFGFTGYMHGYTQSVLLELVWFSIAATSLYRLYRLRKRSPAVAEEFIAATE